MDHPSICRCRLLGLFSLVALVAAGCSSSAGTTPAMTDPPRLDVVATPVRPEPVPEPALHAGILARLAEPRLVPCEETELPAAYRPDAPAAGREDNLGRGMALWQPPAGATSGEQGDVVVQVYRSYRLDPSSELGDAGYRVQIVRNGALVDDLSLGFSERRPYIVVNNPLLPMLDGDVLQIHADILEVDDESITFPPVALRAARDVPNRLLRCPLEELRRDRDGDGLTDLEEERLLTDPMREDTDGDGAGDAFDAAPLAGAQPATPEDELWVQFFREEVAEQVEDQLLVTRVEGRRLDVGELRVRLVTLREDELEAYDAKFGYRVRFRIGITMQSDDAATIDLSYGWRGSEWEATRDASGTWTFVPTGRWISRSDRPARSVALRTPPQTADRPH